MVIVTQFLFALFYLPKQHSHLIEIETVKTGPCFMLFEVDKENITLENEF